MFRMQDVERVRNQQQLEKQNRRTKWSYFGGGFAISVIIVLAMCGFAAVDLSTDQYLPGQFEPIFQIDSWDSDGVCVTAMGRKYAITGEEAAAVNELVVQLRGFLPPSTRWAAMAATETAIAVEEYRMDQQRLLEESWASNGMDNPEAQS